VSSTAPVGIFDSGFGGLSVAHEIRRLLPHEDLLYFADSAFCPYGGRPLDEIRERSLAIGRYLQGRGAKLIVVACNTASGAALEALRAELPIPIVGMEPAVKPAAIATRNRRVGVMATAATLQTDRFERLMREHAQEVLVVSHACPGLVELVERGLLDGDEARRTVADVVRPLQQAGVDTVVLGCTHFPFLRDLVSEAMGPGVIVVESGEAVARQVMRVLQGDDRLASMGDGGLRLITTGGLEEIAQIARSLWNEPFEAEHVAIAAT
jgi:glutamate racemase